MRSFGGDDRPCPVGHATQPQKAPRFFCRRAGSGRTRTPLTMSPTSSGSGARPPDGGRAAAFPAWVAVGLGGRPCAAPALSVVRGPCCSRGRDAMGSVREQLWRDRLKGRLKLEA